MIFVISNNKKMKIKVGNIMKETIFILMIIMFIGCNNTAEKRALKSFQHSCKGKISARLSIGSWNNYLEFYCEDIK